MRLRSLRARMLALSTAVTVVSLLLAGWIMAGVLERFVVQGVDQRLDAQLAVMTSALAPDGAVDSARLEARLGAMEAGPGWRWRIEGPGGSLGSADFPSLDPPPPRGGPGREAEGHIRPVPLDGGEGESRVHARRLVVQTTAGPVTLTAAAPREVISRPILSAMTPLLIVLALLATLFAVATFVQFRLGLRPVMRLQAQVAEIRTGARARLDEDQPTELRPLAEELNALAADSEAALTAARASAANLAHALKTPVATLALMIGEASDERAQLDRIESVIRHHLSRARATTTGHRVTTELAPVLADLAGAIGALHRDVAIACDVAAGLSVALDPHDLSEIAGNLMDNAARHARTRVRVTAMREGRRVRLTVIDDGPGIPAAARAAVVQAGVRLDERESGDGFGLAIVRDVAALHGGTLTLDDAPGGGLLVELILPAAASVARTASLART